MNVNPTPAAKTVAGGGLITKPRVTYALIALNVAIFGIQFLQGIDTLAVDYGMWPIGIANDGEWWRLFTSAFLHGSFIHIAFNMYVLFFLGPTLERILGHTRFLILYVLAALGGSVASYWFSDINTVSVGASGAIFGLMGALVVAGHRLKYDITQVLILLGINVVIGFISPNVDWRAHFGGLVIGALVAAIMVLPPKRIRIPAQVAGIAALLVLLIVLTIIRTEQIQELIAPFVGVTT
jgi:membrane associated rhomboid family serine protease